MNGAVSLAFLGVTLAAAAALRIRRLPRDLLLIAASVAFVFFIAWNPIATLPFWLLVGGGFVVVTLARHAARLAVLLALLAIVVFAWWWLRESMLAALGLSYAMFRILHLAIDIRDDQLGHPLTLRRYLCYLTFFPGFLAGPVQRYQDFAGQLEAPPARVPGRAWKEAGRRALRGVFKCTVLAGLAMYLHQAAVWSVPTDAALALAVAALAFAAWLYFAFAGYMDIVIAAGRVLGVVLPENFDHALASRNFLDVWSRWHITLSEWFKFYVFNPTLKAMLEAVPSPALAPWLASAAFFLTFFLMGIWHGRTPALILYGLVLGAGVSVNKLYQVWLAKALGKKRHAELTSRPAYRLAAQSLALAYFVLALTFLWPIRPDETGAGAPSMAIGALIVLAVCAVLALMSRVGGEQGIAWPRALVPAAIVVEAAAAATYLWLTGGAVPDLLYQRL